MKLVKQSIHNFDWRKGIAVFTVKTVSAQTLHSFSDKKNAPNLDIHPKKFEISNFKLRISILLTKVTRKLSIASMHHIHKKL